MLQAHSEGVAGGLPTGATGRTTVPLDAETEQALVILLRSGMRCRWGTRRYRQDVIAAPESPVPNRREESFLEPV